MASLTIFDTVPAYLGCLALPVASLWSNIFSSLSR